MEAGDEKKYVMNLVLFARGAENENGRGLGLATVTLRKEGCNEYDTLYEGSRKCELIQIGPPAVSDQNGAKRREFPWSFDISRENVLCI